MKTLLRWRALLLVLSLLLAASPAHAAAAKDVLYSERDSSAGVTNHVWTGRDIAAGRMVVAVFVADGGTAAPISSFTSPNLTWTNRVAAVDAGNNHRVEIWTAFASAALTAEVITQLNAGGSYNLQSFVLITVSGTDSSGAGNTATDIDSSPADPTLTVTSTASGSYIVAGLQGRGSGDTIEDGNTTQEYSTGSWAGFAFGERVWSRSTTGAGGYTLASTGDDPVFWVMAGLEIKSAGGGPPPCAPTLTLLGVSSCG